MQVVLVFDPDPTLGYTTPGDMDGEVEPLRRAVYIGEAEDVVVVRRTYHEAYEGGVRTEVWQQGVYEHLDWEAMADHLEALLQALPDEPEPGAPDTT